MYPYIFVLISVVFLSLCYNNSYYKDNSIARLLFISSVIIILVLFSSLRSFDVGTDTKNYVYMFDFLYEQQVSQPSLFNEYGFVLLQFLAKCAKSDYRMVMVLVSIITIMLSIVSIKDYSRYFTLSMFLYLTIGVYSLHLNIARQAISLAIFLFAIRYIIKGDFIKYCFTIFIGFLFHKSILLCLPFYFVLQKSFKLKHYILLMICISSFFVFLNYSMIFFSNSIGDKYLSYSSESSEYKGLFQALFYAAIFGFTALFKNKSNDSNFNLFYNLTFVGVVIGLTSSLLKFDPNGFARVSMYFNQGFIFTLPLSVFSLKSTLMRTISLVVFLFCFLFYYVINIQLFSDLYPYELL